MNKLFELEISRPGSFGATATLSLPAAQYEIQGALDKIRMADEGVLCSTEILHCRLDYLPQFLSTATNLYELNHLAQRLAALSEWELDCFEGLVMMDAIQTDYAPIPTERLINMTHSLESCQIAYEAHDDETLGKFYADNGFVPELEQLPENVFAWLDYGKIGKEMREGEGGVFTPHGYVVQNGELLQVYQGGRLETCASEFADKKEVLSMKENPYPYPWRELPGSAEETRFLGERMETLSVRESYLLEGAACVHSVETAAELIDLAEQLDRFALYYGATDDEALGRYAAEYRETVSPDLIPFLKLEQWGREFRDQHDGAFTSGGFVEQVFPLCQTHNGKNLDRLAGNDAVLRLRLASDRCPNGVWMKLPDYEANTNEPDELDITLRELGVTDWEQAILMEARCCLENITNLSDQYESLRQLIEDGNNLGYVLEEQGQGMACFEERFRAAMELEGCTRLDHALDISQNLGCYDFIPTEQHWERFGTELARRNDIVKPDSPAGQYFDSIAYCKAEIEQMGLQPCAHGYIARNDQEFIHEFSQPLQEQGMSIQP